MSIRCQRILYVVLLAAGCLLVGGCSAKAPDSKIAPQTELADISRFPQDLRIYADAAGGEKSLLSPRAQASHYARFNKLWFSPWDSKPPRPGQKKLALVAPRDWGQGNASGYAGNLRRWAPEAQAKLLANARESAYPSCFVPAITVRNTALRALPGEQPLFGDPSRPGQGYPFDLFRYTSLPVGMPVLITHTSADGAWVFVENAVCGGWMPTKDAASIDESTRQQYRAHGQTAFVREGVTLRDEAGRFLALANVGTVLPAAEDGGAVLVPVRDADGAARLCRARVTPRDAVRMPLALTPDAVARIGNEFMGRPYGWGGLNGERDCSALTRDLFTPFGIWLPRNSSRQRREWSQVSLEGLTSAEKIGALLERGRPFASLIYAPGHIMLYVGEMNGTPIIFHAMWGIRTDGDGKIAGRFLVGQVVVTSLTPGKELRNVQKKNLLLNRIRNFTVLDE